MMGFYYFCGILLFINGILIMILRRSFIYILIGIELSLNALSFLFFLASRSLGNPHGEIFAILLFGIAAAGIAVGLAILINLVKAKGTQDVEEFKDTGG